ncbi:2'-5' RNA ligase [hydrothermal vent metagenome]|uniref:2'-5' RNA ligase n=1 Tax=hydrothermal vent metagenome TaxID=652676 RepID=A0A3B1BB90_9ZZZZ
MLRRVDDEPVSDDTLNVRRLFFAIDLPLETIASAERLIESVSDIPITQVRWVHSVNLHITLKFLGDVENEKTFDICDIAKKVFTGFGPINLSVEGMGLFPNHDNPKVVWLGVHGNTEELAKMELNLSAGLEKLGYPPDQKKFTAHLTIGRVKNESARGKLVRLARKYHDTYIGDASADSVALYESKLNPGGAIYSVVDRFPLCGE